MDGGQKANPHILHKTKPKKARIEESVQWGWRVKGAPWKKCQGLTWGTHKVPVFKKVENKTWRCSSEDRVHHKWLNKIHYIFFCQVCLQQQDIFKAWKSLETLLGNKLLSSAFPAISSLITNPRTQPLKVTVTTRVLTHRCDVCWTLPWSHSDSQRTWPLWGTGQKGGGGEDGERERGRGKGKGGGREIKTGMGTEREEKRGGGRVTQWHREGGRTRDDTSIEREMGGERQEEKDREVREIKEREVALNISLREQK